MSPEPEQIRPEQIHHRISWLRRALAEEKTRSLVSDSGTALVALADLVRAYITARDEFEDCNIVAEPQRAKHAAVAVEKASNALWSAVGLTP